MATVRKSLAEEDVHAVAADLDLFHREVHLMPLLVLLAGMGGDHLVDELGHEIAGEDGGAAFDEVRVYPENGLLVDLQVNV